MSSAHSNQQVNATPKHESITGVVERLTFHSEESGYTVARLQRPGVSELTTITGSFAGIQPGQTLQLTGFWREHPQYGLQFQVVNYKETKPATITGIEKYLGSGLIKGVGPVTAKRIVNHFGLETLNIIENQIERLQEVNGIAKKRITMIQKAWQTQKAIKEVMVFLQTHGVSTTYAVKIYKQYGDLSIHQVNENPYQLATDIYGIGFLTADQIARNLGVPPGSEFRYRAGLIHVLSEAAEEGHCYLPQPELIQQVTQRLKTNDHQPSEEAITEIISKMSHENELIREISADTTLCYKPTFFYTEQNLAISIQQRLIPAININIDIPRVRNWIERFCNSRKVTLSPQQQQAVEIAAYSNFMVITGGPGVGKTFTTHTIVSLWKAMGKSIALAAPTGRAAQRLGEMTGLEAKTLHRLLEFDPKTRGFKRNKNNPLPYSAIIVDEASMLDLFLAHSLVQALGDAQLLLVGDIDQLPSVGAGNVLADLINSGKVPVVRLTQVFRQAATSKIITAAHQINLGQQPNIETISNTPKSDCLWHGGGYQPEHGVQAICELINDFIPKLGYYPATDVQVLCPMSRGLVGTRNLNNVLQQLINPPSSQKVEVTRGGTIYRTGDRIIQLTNDYQREVFNGDVGFITHIDTEEQEVKIQYQEREVTYDYADLNEIALAWSVTIHKCVAGYGLTSIEGRGLVQVENVAVGEKICTGIGTYKQVLDHIQTGKKQIVRVLTRNGYTIDVSAEHPLLVASKEEFPHFRKASELTSGIFACIDRSGVDGGIVNLPEVSYQNTRKAQKRINVPTILTEDLAWALGVIVGDGSYRDRRDGTIEITSQDLELLDKYKFIFEGFGLNVSVRLERNHYRAYFVSKPLRNWLETLGLDYALAFDKKTPHVIFSATVQVRAAYLRGLFDTDGSVGKINTRFTSSSKQLVQDVHNLLLSIGVISILSSQGERHHKVTVSGPSIIPFFNMVNFVIERKYKLLSILVEKAIKKGKANIDVIPFGTQLINEFKETVTNTRGVKGQGLKANRSRKYYFVNQIAKENMQCTYTHLQKIIEFSLIHNTYLPDNIQKTINANYFFDKIISVEYLADEITMYDLEVDEHHSFTVNGFVCHNSQGSEYPVVILPLYTQHYMMLSRNLLYTGLTRAKKLAIIIGSKKAIYMCVRSTKSQERYTQLKQRLVIPPS